MTEQIRSGYVLTDTEQILVQLPAENAWGFVLCDDDQSWDGGLGAAHSWELLDDDDPRIGLGDRIRLSWLLDEPTPAPEPTTGDIDLYESNAGQLYLYDEGRAQVFHGIEHVLAGPGVSVGSTDFRTLARCIAEGDYADWNPEPVRLPDPAAIQATYIASYDPTRDTITVTDLHTPGLAAQEFLADDWEDEA